MSSNESNATQEISKCLGCKAHGNLGRRYECIVCGESVTYCGDCYDGGKNVPNDKHKYYHPMKAIYNQDFFELYFLGEEMVNGEAPQSYKCAFCDELGFTAEELQLHVLEKHSGHSDAPQLLDILEQMKEQQKGEFARLFGSQPDCGSGLMECKCRKSHFGKLLATHTHTQLTEWSKGCNVLDALWLGYHDIVTSSADVIHYLH